MLNPKDSSNNNNLLERSAEDAQYSLVLLCLNNHVTQYNLAYLYGKGIEKNLERAFYWYQRAAENGNKSAMNSLAICYNNGEGTEKNLEKSFYWYQKAAEKGIIEAQYHLALLYRFGKGTEKNLENAFHWYQKAAKNGNKSAMNGLAICYKNGEGTEKNLEKASYWSQKLAKSDHMKEQKDIKKRKYYSGENFFDKLSFSWCQKEAENGNKDAMNGLAICYKDGKGTKKNLGKALYWLQKAAKNDQLEAQFHLAFLYNYGEGIEKNLEKAFYWYKKAAENGNDNAQYFLASLYFNGEGTEKNLGKAFYWYKKAAENGDNDAMDSLAICYKDGKGTKKDLGKALYWLQKAAKNVHLEAQFHLALLYNYGEGIEKNLEKAFYWYKKAAENEHTGAQAAENEHAEAQYHLAYLYDNGEGTEKNLEKAFYWYQKAAANENAAAQYHLAYLYDNGEGIEKNLEKAFYWYKKAAENGSKSAMNNLAVLYQNGEGTKKNLEKAFYWYKKAAENGNDNAQYYLASLYFDGEGTEKDLEKSFYWNQKAAENDNIEAQHHLGLQYQFGKGTEMNLDKAFYWYQKAAENGYNNAQYYLASLYFNGEETEKDLEKSFYWYQKAAENGHNSAMNNLAWLYFNGKGTERNLEKAFYWLQKGAEIGNNNAINNLVKFYKNGVGTEKNLEKAFYWYQRAAENGEVDELYDGECKGCKQPYIYYQWCQKCNSKQFQQDFSKWTSKNEFIDKFIQEAQLNAKNINEVLEWIPYDKLKNVNYYDKGGFSEIYKAIWLDGPIDSWNFDEKRWNRWTFQKGYEVILKNLNNSSNLNDKFLNEWKYNYNCQKKSFSKFVRFFGITQDQDSLNYVIVMSYVKEGSLRKNLSNVVKSNWHEKLQLLKKIVLGLKIIHESGIIHCDLHDGNILISNNEVYIIDLGLCKPINNLQSFDGVYGVLPYIAPEVIRGKPYTSKSDTYSFSMIMWEFISGVPPFNNRAHDHHLSLSICEGERPEIIKNTPKHYIGLMKECWDLEPTKRPTLKSIENTISEWLSCFDRYEIVEGVEYIKDTKHVTSINDLQVRIIMEEFAKVPQRQTTSSIIQSHPQAYYKSQLHKKVDETLDQDRELVFSSNSDRILLNDKSECFECVIDD